MTAERRAGVRAHALIARAGHLFGRRGSLSRGLAAVGGRDDPSVSEIARPHGGPVVAGDTAAATRGR